LGAPEGFVARLRAVGDILAQTSGALGRRLEVDVLALLGERAALAGLHRGGDVSCGGAARLLRAADGWLAVNLPRPEDVELLPAWLVDADLGPERISELANGHSPATEPAGATNPERITHRNGGQSAPPPAGSPATWGADAAAGAGRAVWAVVAAAVAAGPARPLAERAQLLGLAVAAVPDHPAAIRLATGPFAGLPLGSTEIGSGEPSVNLEGLIVGDLSSLWAGPLCSNLLQQAGARVIKIEAVHRPDGTRRGAPAFFDLLHAGQESVALDFGTPEGRADLRLLLGAVDVVIEGSRPRALEQLDIGAEAVLAGAARAAGGPRVWVSITGYGRAAPGRNRVAFGDDAAAGGGLVVWDGTGPCFCADAVADPCTGIVAATAVLRALAAGGRWLLDISMRDVAAHLAGLSSSGPAPAGSVADPAGTEAGAVIAAPPRARAVVGRGPGLGEHTEAVFAELGLARRRR
jgi:hypothetical protein